MPKQNENLWINPPDPSLAFKSIIDKFRHTYNVNDVWDADFVLNEIPQEKAMNKPVYAMVVSSKVYALLKNRTEFQSSNTPCLRSIVVIQDKNQSEDCVEFYDVEILNLYLNRINNPVAWATHCSAGLGVSAANNISLNNDDNALYEEIINAQLKPGFPNF